MRKRRVIALVLGVFMSISSLPSNIFANSQKPVENVSDQVTIGHSVSGSGSNTKIRPVMDIKFTPPEGADNNGDIDDPNAAHGVGYYQVNLKEYPGGNVIRAPEDPNSLPKGNIDLDKGIEVHEHTDKMKNGKIYEVGVVPYHKHRYEREGPNGEIIREERLISPNGPQPFQYILTDFDTKIEGGEDSITVTWEDTGFKDMNYKIGYAQGNYETGDDIKSNQWQYIDADDIKENAKTYVDPDTSTQRYSYTIKNNIATGQMYSAFVISDTDIIGGKKLISNKTAPKISTTTTRIGLNVFGLGKDKIRLEWNAKSLELMEGSYKLSETFIKEFLPGDESGQTIAILKGIEGARAGYYEYREPKQEAQYQLVFKYQKDGIDLVPDPKTPKITYVPGELRIRPITPTIPKPIGPTTKVTEENKNDYLLANDQLKDTLLGDIWKSDHTFHANMTSPTKMNLVWSAYNHKDGEGNKLVDLSTLYDITISDDFDLINSEIAPLVEDLSFYGGQNADDILYNQQADIVGFRQVLETYLDSNQEIKPLTPNKVYYVKVVAKKRYGDEFEKSSPVIKTILFNGDGEIFIPPMISKPPLKLKEESLGKTSATVMWLESWHEILARNPDLYKDLGEKEKARAKNWNSKVYTGSTSGPGISFVKNDENTEHILKNQRDLDRVKVQVKDYKDKYIDRKVKLGKNVRYKYKLLPYKEIQEGLEAYNSQFAEKISLEEYIENLMLEEAANEEENNWQKVEPDSYTDENYIEWKEISQDNLKPNTSYVFFVKPYTKDYDGTSLETIIPTWTLITTLPDSETPEGRPTVPNLGLYGKSDTEISVEWEYNSNFDYEIRYSRLENPDTATVWPFEISNDLEDPNFVEDGGRAVKTIKGLFPDTSYNIWIRAKQKKGDKISAWSNPVSTKTDVLGKPVSPPGLGIASYQSILELERDFQPVDHDYITVEWEKIAADKDLEISNQENQRVQKEYKYVIEFAGNPEFLDLKRVTIGEENIGEGGEGYEILDKTMVLFNDLIGNRPYYVRAKTVLLAQDQENNRELKIESAYTDVIRIITKASQGEYDGEDKANEVIYPEKIKEDYKDDTWTYEVLDTQRLITEVVKGDQYKYLITMDKYQGRHDPKYRIIKMPQSLVKALINRGMELEVRTNNLRVKLPAQALESYMLNTSTKDILELKFTSLNQGDLYILGQPKDKTLFSKPENLEINLRGESIKEPLKALDKLLGVEINMPKGVTSDMNLQGYSYNPHLASWEKGNTRIDKINNRLAYTVKAPGIYMAYQGLESQNLNQGNNMDVGINQFINIILGQAENKANININKIPSSSEITKARNSGLYTGPLSGKLTQEDAINGIVKLYELKQGLGIRPSSASGLEKARIIGLIDYVNPSASISYGELYTLIDQVIY